MQLQGKKSIKSLVLWVALVLCAAMMLGACASDGDYYYDGGLDGSPADVDMDSGQIGEKKIIYNFRGSLHVDNVAKAVERVNAQVAGYADAYVQSASVSHSAEMVLRVPADDLEAFVAQLRTLGDMKNESLTSEDVTRAVLDLEALKQAKEAEEARLLALFDQATTTAEIILISDRLAHVQAELNEINTMLKSYDLQIALSRVTLSIYSNYVEEEESFGDQIARAFVQSGQAFVAFFKFLLLAIIYVGPFLLLGGGITALVLLRERKSFKLRQQKKAEEARLKAETEVKADLESKKVDAQDAQAEKPQESNSGDDDKVS